MTPAEAGRMLEAFAEKMIEAAQDTIRRDHDVLPAVVTVDASGACQINCFRGFDDAEQRLAFKRACVEATDAIAVMLFSDAWTRKVAGGAVTGEVLTAFVETRDSAEAVAISCHYTRSPLIFGPVERSAAATLVGAAFEHTTDRYRSNRS